MLSLPAEELLRYREIAPEGALKIEPDERVFPPSVKAIENLKALGMLGVVLRGVDAICVELPLPLKVSLK
jgi:hypothetical protein